MDCTVFTVIIYKCFAPICFWTFRDISGLAEPAYVISIYPGILYGVLRIPQQMAGKGLVMMIIKIKNLVQTFLYSLGVENFLEIDLISFYPIPYGNTIDTQQPSRL